MNNRKKLNEKRTRRAKRAKAKILGTGTKPRLSVFRSNRYVYAQLIDDEKRHTLASVSTIEVKKAAAKSGKTAQSERAGEELAKKALAAGIKQAVFDRGAYKYHGRIKAIAESARKGGLKI
jgi:large subunit ribosomal protein L18